MADETDSDPPADADPQDADDGVEEPGDGGSGRADGSEPGGGDGSADDSGGGDGSGGGLSPAEPEDHSAPGQAPSESVETPPDDASDGDGPAYGEGAVDAADADASDADADTDDANDTDAADADADDETGDADTVDAETPDADTTGVETADPLAEPEPPTGEADGGVITDDDAISPVDDERDGHLVDEALVDEQPTEPPDDEEMPLADHIEEMVRRLAVVVLIAGTVSLVLFPLAEYPIDFLWNNILPTGEATDPRVYGPLELMFTRLKVASLGGLVVALPVFVYETYQFMRPGLYPHERRYYLAAVPTSLVLALVGIGFAYFFVLPAIFIYFLEYTQGAALVAFSLKKTFDLILILMGYLAIVFQIPLFIMLAIMMGLTTRQWLADRRIYFWGGFLGVSFFFGIDPTGMAPIIVAATMVVLFEGTLLLLKWTGRG